jgi:hypothetical protein
MCLLYTHIGRHHPAHSLVDNLLLSLFMLNDRQLGMADETNDGEGDE